MQRAHVTYLVLALIVGCRDQAIVTSPATPRISADIQDGAHGGGNPHFFFLPPTVAQPSFSGVFNPNLGPVVQICTLTATAAGTMCDATIAPIIPGAVQQVGHQYQVNWNTGATNVSASSTYRIQVLAANELLGFADVQPMTDGSALKNLRTGDIIGLVDGRTLPIKFRIESGALCFGSVDCGEGTVGSAGGTVVSQNQLAGVQFPAGAVTNTVTVLVQQITTQPCLPIDLVQRVECYDFVTSPPGQFQSNVTVAICVDLESFTGLPAAEKPWFLLHRLDVVNSQPVVTSLPNAPATFLPCDASETFQPPTVGMRGLDRWFAFVRAGSRHLIEFFTPRKLYAFHLGVGGSTCCFSRIGWALPAGMSKNSGDGQTAAVGTPVAVAPSVILHDSGGGPAVGEKVTFSVGSGGGSVTGATPVTDQNGVATVGSWTLGAAAGANTLLATSRSAVGSPVTITATALTFTAVEAAERQSCASGSNGVAYCWGSNLLGQLGNGQTSDQHLPTPVSGGLGFTSLSSAFEHTCALGPGGQANCWGRNDSLQLGDGTATNRATPALVSGGLTFRAISTGGLHTCALTAAGAAYCWGANDRGQLGTGSRVSSSVPVPVSGNFAFSMITAGFYHTCGLTAAGAAFCWGSTFFGALGTGSVDGLAQCGGNVACSTTPVPVSGGLVFTSLTAGALYTCGLTPDGTAYCWGNNTSAQLGSGPATFDPQLVPTPVSGGLHFVSLNAESQNDFYAHTCAITADNIAYCWGQNVAGELGAPTTEVCPGLFANNPPHACATAPVPVSGGLLLKAITPGLDHTCGITTSGQLYCWGANTTGQLGNGTTTPSLAPVLVSGPSSS